MQLYENKKIVVTNFHPFSMHKISSIRSITSHQGISHSRFILMDLNDNVFFLITNLLFPKSSYYQTISKYKTVKV